MGKWGEGRGVEMGKSGVKMANRPLQGSNFCQHFGLETWIMSNKEFGKFYIFLLVVRGSGNIVSDNFEEDDEQWKVAKNIITFI